jgi:biopolymer transport protein ExbB
MDSNMKLLVHGILVLLLLLSASNLAAQAPAAAPGAAAPAGQNPAPAEQAEQAKGPQGFFAILFSGGPVGVAIMLVLIGLSLTAAYLVFDNVLAIRRPEIIPAGISEQVKGLVATGRIHDAAKLCSEKPSFVTFVVLHGLNEIDGGWSEVEKAMEDAAAEQSARLFRKVEYLSVLGNIAPMVGLLGTVTGMLMAFKEVADSAGSAGASQLAEGIYQALVTTVVGLIIAIPSLGAFAIFRNRVDQFVAEASYAALHALSPLKRGRIAEPKSTLPPTPPPPPPRASATR